jgi:glycosyltransferase involved in cell wall biosynthesis
MCRKNILYVSTNNMWSGSEELWSRSAKKFIELGYSISFAVKYNHKQLEGLQAKARNINYSNRYLPKTRLQRGIERISKHRFDVTDLLKDFIVEAKPELVLISQGNNYESLELMQLCGNLGIPYITITQLVSELFIWISQNQHVTNYRNAYIGAKKNFFVSKHNLNVNNFQLGYELLNSEVAYNPCKISDIENWGYPKIGNTRKIGLVGRIECYHKGYDILLQVLNNDKWRNRPIEFNIYGDGPNTDFIKLYIEKWELRNVYLKGHVAQITDVWAENELLLLPSRLEGQALALIEAMYCHRAAVITDVGGGAELIEEGVSGFIASYPTVSSIDAALERAWNQRNEWRVMGNNAAAALKDRYPEDAVDYFNKRVLEVL